MFSFPSVLIPVIFLVSMAAYFIMMSDRLNMKLWIFFLISLVMTAAVFYATVKIFSFFNFFAVAQCLLYDAGSLIHLISGKKTVKEVTQLK